MALFSFGKRPKHRSFDYKPRFYDQEKEDFEARIGKYKKERTGDAEQMKTRIRGGFGKQIYSTYGTEGHRNAVRKSNKLVMMIAMCLLAAVVYFLLIYFPKIVTAFN